MRRFTGKDRRPHVFHSFLQNFDKYASLTRLEGKESSPAALAGSSGIGSTAREAATNGSVCYAADARHVAFVDKKRRRAESAAGGPVIVELTPEKEREETARTGPSATPRLSPEPEKAVLMQSPPPAKSMLFANRDPVVAPSEAKHDGARRLVSEVQLDFDPQCFVEATVDVPTMISLCQFLAACQADSTGVPDRTLGAIRWRRIVVTGK
ncbi:MAG: hypothetical protein BJ554DRAFT_6436 [Olpidium bornovanus]|uniref:Uncharacterized protein n=1 Tax=Olpidium bornovanus TaxID=278681 RepID=A0A8H7ZXR7_9FUNG|nr:MAG: hypothetical protein BJ554DRAFT_6436 [Olpidium bornovanus]